MGNRAVITASKDREDGCAIGIYVHWNGGIASVQAFLDVAKARGFRCPSGDETYGLARLCGLIHEYFGVNESTGVGIGTLSQLDCNNYDNGVYVIGEGWTIADRWGDGSKPYSAVDIYSARKSEQYEGIVKQLTLEEVS